MIDVIKLYDLQDTLIVHKGLIGDTLPDVLTNNTSLTFSLAYVDVNLYEPTKLIVESLHDRLAKNGLLIFDEWNSDYMQGEGKAVNEFLKDHSSDYEMKHVMNSRQPSLILKKINC